MAIPAGRPYGAVSYVYRICVGACIRSQFRAISMGKDKGYKPVVVSLRHPCCSV